MNSERTLKLDASWQQVLQEDFDQEYMQVLRGFLLKEKQQRKVIFPKGDLIFNCMNATPFEAVKVVVLGQDPYHGPGQAHGLSFSVLPGVQLPPSLQNIFKEINSDLGIANTSGCLEHWAKQGVLLLNSVLTVEQGKAASHQGQGWEQFTDSIIAKLNQQREGIVFLLWGSYAQKKGAIIDSSKHLVLKSPHPSPLSAHRGFFGNKHFSKANEYLVGQGKSAIDWSTPG